MKFGKTLKDQQGIPLFRGLYVAYKTMKKLLQEVEKTDKVKEQSMLNIKPTSANPKKPEFEVFAQQLWWFDATQPNSLVSCSNERIQLIRLVESEITKAQKYYESQVARLREMLDEIFTRINSMIIVSTIHEDLDAISAELLLLDKYIYLAKKMIGKITKKHDKRSNFKVQQWMLVRLEKESFWNSKLDDLIIGLSDVYTIARNMVSRGRVNERQSVADAKMEDFVRKNQKFFIKPEDVMLVKLAIIRHLPIDIFGRKIPKIGQQNKLKLSLGALTGVNDSSVISSIYLDNEEKTMYHERLGIEGPKGNLIRIRWYGPYTNPPKECWVERKTKQKVQMNDHIADDAIKERFRISEANVKPYISGHWNISNKLDSMMKKGRIQPADAEELRTRANSIQQEIVSKKLGPVLRTVCRRSAFQLGVDQTLRISLDASLHIINESTPKENKMWTRNMLQPLDYSEVIALPYAVLELKTQADPPQWVVELKESGYLLDCENYSKFLYGTVKLWPNGVRLTPKWWEVCEGLGKSVPRTPPISECYLLQEIGGYAPLSQSKRNVTTSENKPAADNVDSPRERRLTFITATNNFIPLLYNRKERPEQDVRKMLKNPEIHSTAPVTKSIKKTKQIEMQEIVQQPSISMSVERMAPVEEKRVPKKEVGVTVKSHQQITMDQRTAKTFFANERTLLSWVNTATFLSLAGLSMLNTRTKVGIISGTVLTGVTVIFVLYALWKFLRRLTGLKQTESAGLEDKVGPPLLIGTFCAAILLVGIYFSATLYGQA